MRHFEFDSASPDATRRFGAALGRLAEAGLVVGLRGGLGGGKTTFVRGVAEGAGTPDLRIVTSPTFALIQEYPGRIPVYHFDAYRLPRIEEFLDLGAEEYFHGDGVCLVEWADRVEPALPGDRIDVGFAAEAATRRRILAACVGDRWSPLLEAWRGAVADAPPE